MSTSPPVNNWYHKWYRFPVSMNLRLPDDLAASLRSLAEETGQSQQVLIREAIDLYLRDYKLQAYPPEIRYAITPATMSFGEALAAASALGPIEALQGEKSVVDMIRQDRDHRG
jgi:hypothetical protein